MRMPFFRHKPFFLAVRFEILVVYCVVGVLVIAQVGLGLTYDKLLRSLHGIPEGVSFQGVNLSRLYPDEVREIITSLVTGTETNVMPTLSVAEIREQLKTDDVGDIDVEATVQKILKAEQGTDVKPVMKLTRPAAAWNTQKEVRRVENDMSAVALTINVAWGEEYIIPILDILDKYDARATFFFIGRWVKLNPGLTRTIAERGHEIANHGYEHIHPLAAQDSELRSIITENEKLLYSITGAKTRLFAPPYGEVDSRIVKVAAGLGYTTVMWDVDTIDWQRPSPDVIVQRVTSKIRSGSIVLMHPTEPTAAALGTILNYLSTKGYRCVSVSDLIASAD